MSMKKRCLECGSIIHGRIDKKYCSESCRNSYNNYLNRDLNNLMRSTHNNLRKNYRLLQGIMKESSLTKVDKKELINQGFDFKLHTHIYTTKNGSVYYYIYDLGYLQINKEQLVIVKKEAYL